MALEILDVVGLVLPPELDLLQVVLDDVDLLIDPGIILGIDPMQHNSFFSPSRCLIGCLNSSV